MPTNDFELTVPDLYRLLVKFPCINSTAATNFPKHIYHPQRSCGKVMFLHLSVILFTGGLPYPSGQTPLADTLPGADTPLGRHPWTDTSPCTVHDGIRSTSGRYASFWNAILLKHIWCRESCPEFLGIPSRCFMDDTWEYISMLKVYFSVVDEFHFPHGLASKEKLSLNLFLIFYTQRSIKENKWKEPSPLNNSMQQSFSTFACSTHNTPIAVYTRTILFFLKIIPNISCKIDIK